MSNFACHVCGEEVTKPGNVHTWCTHKVRVQVDIIQTIEVEVEVEADSADAHRKARTEALRIAAARKGITLENVPGYDRLLDRCDPGDSIFFGGTEFRANGSWPGEK